MAAAFFLGIVNGVEPRWIPAFAALLLVFLHGILSKNVKKAFAPAIFFLIGLLFAHMQIKVPKDNALPLKGAAYFSPATYRTDASEKGGRIHMRGNLTCFTDSGGRLIAKNIPCAISAPLPQDIRAISPDSDWIIQGTLVKSNGSGWKLIPLAPVFWREIENPLNTVVLRQEMKNSAADFIRTHIRGEKNQNLIIGMITGSFSDPEISSAFQQFGLQHILAISGFHFSLFALIATAFLKPFFKGRTLTCLLSLALTFYFFFLGGSPSVQRAFAMITLGLIASLLGRNISPFNALGAALFLTLIYDPLSVKSPGFILSFAITFSILAFTAPFSRLLKNIFPERSFHEISAMGLLDKIGLIALSALKEMTALNLAVHLTAVPLTLALFGSFPIFSLLFNIFFPTLAGFVIFAFVLSSLLHCIGDFLSTFSFEMTSLMTSALLSFALDMPSSWNIQIRMDLAEDGASSLAFGLFILAIFISKTTEDASDEEAIAFPTQNLFSGFHS